MKQLLLFALLFSGSLYAQDGGAPVPPRDQGIWQTITMVAIALVFFYFILWRPEQKRRQVIDELRSNLKKGDRVTAMGIIGTVVRIDEKTVILKMVDGSRIEFLKGAITDVIGSEEGEKEKTT